MGSRVPAAHPHPKSPKVPPGRVARQSLPCYAAVGRLGFKRRATVELKSIILVRHTAVTPFETGLKRFFVLAFVVLKVSKSIQPNRLLQGL